jgi:putative membrane protein
LLHYARAMYLPLRIYCRPALAATCAIALLGTACASDQKPAPTQAEVANGEALPEPPPVPAKPASTDSPATVTPPPAPDALTEGQIAKLAELANSSEVAQGLLAKDRAKAPNVKAFADMMVKHHSEAKQDQAKLFSKLGLTPADSPSASALRDDGTKTLQTLQKADAASFDAVYVNSQIDGHQKVLELIDSQLLPAAKTPELTDALHKMKTTVENHLTGAKALKK